ncbi:hypothetical protein [Streptomyces sp. PSAA01]|uniref:hypothetical protein n=1 Tax=Streptomyces sp. PSAA01 TaxID=2912762 RepID=UPI001F4211E6|nr:hypothetical protein [Streptomyces sp. PSAA01]MCG0284502.1 hypothetical protein [Streptomyces sp. PSAA01]
MLNEASSRICRSPDMSRAAQELADVAVPGFADAVSVDLLESVLDCEEPTPGLVCGVPNLRNAGWRTLGECPPEAEQQARDGDLALASRCMVQGQVVAEPPPFAGVGTPLSARLCQPMNPAAAPGSRPRSRSATPPWAW